MKFKSIFCGSSHGERGEEEQEEHKWSPSTPKKSYSPFSPRKKSSSSSSPSSTPRKSFSRSNKSIIYNSPRKKDIINYKNPYSNRGLDKFAMVLADLNEKREQICEELGSKDVDAVRFSYSISKGCWVPIVVVKQKNENQCKPELSHVDMKAESKENQKPAQEFEKKSSLPSTDISHEQPKAPSSDKIEMMKKKKQKKDREVLKTGTSRWQKRLYYKYWPVVLIVMILFCLAVYGRSVAVICTLVFWYLMPIMMDKDSDVNMKRISMKKKDSLRSLSEKKMMINTCGTLSPNKSTKNLNPATVQGSSPRWHDYKL